VKGHRHGNRSIRAVPLIGPVAANEARRFAAVGATLFDCGVLNVDSLAMFGLQENESFVKQLFVPCYLVQHEQGLLFWEGGLPRTIADSEGAVAIEAGTLFYER